MPWHLGIGLSLLGGAALAWGGPQGTHFFWNLGGITASFAGMILLATCKQLTGKKALFLCLVLGTSVRLFFWGYPPSDDFHRYAWEGKVGKAGENPYLKQPLHADLRDKRDKNWTGINHPEIPSVYPPVSQFLFQGISLFYPSPFPLRLAVWISELLAIFFLYAGLKARGYPIRHLFWYSLNPACLIYFSGELHLDAFVVLCLAGLIYFQAHNYHRALYLGLGLGALIKFFPAVLFPAVIHKSNWKSSWIFFLPLFLYLFYWSPGANLFQGLHIFAQEFSFNSPGETLIFSHLGRGSWLIKLCLLGFLAGAHLLVEPRIEKNCFFIIFLSLLLSSTIHPWYLTLALPFVIFHPSPAYMLLIASSLFTLWPMYAQSQQTGLWKEPAYSQWLIWGPAFLLAFFRKSLVARELKDYAQPPPVQTLSIIVPVLNEEEKLPKFLTQLIRQTNHLDCEILLVDGGSQDNTQQIAQTFGVTLIPSPLRGRGYQIYAGVCAAKNDVCVILHADCVASPAIFTDILTSLNESPLAAGGWHSMRFAGARNWRLQILERVNNMRARFLGISFGDQMQFVRTHIAKNSPLIRNMPLMEDVNLSLELKKTGVYLFNRGAIEVSPRRWENHKLSANAFLVIRLVVTFLFLKRFGLLKYDSPYFEKAYYHTKRSIANKTFLSGSKLPS